MADDPRATPPESCRPRPLRDVIFALALKACLLAAIYVLFFGPSGRPAADAGATAAALTGPAIHEATR